MTFDKWVQTYNGKKIDYDGYAGVQCVDLAKHFIDKVMGKTPLSIGNAKEYWLKRNGSYIKSTFVAIKNTDEFVPRKADVFVRTSGTCGHIGVCNGDSTTEYFCAYEQNAGGTHEGMTRHKHTNWATINFLRPRYQYVKANGGLHAYKSIKDSKPSALIENGTKVEILKGNVGRKAIDNKIYQMQQIKVNGSKYIVADEYFEAGK